MPCYLDLQALVKRTSIMEITIQKDTSVSLHKQLVTQVSMQIASGLLDPGVKLPSIRALSAKLGIHHNTCLSAYRELESHGLIEIRHGSGARVANLDPDASIHALPAIDLDKLSLESLAEFFMRQTTRMGYRWDDVLTALQMARAGMGQPERQSVLFVDIHADILPVFQTELQQYLNRPVQTALLSQLNPRAERNTHFVVSRYHYQALREMLKQAYNAEPGDAPAPDFNERITVIDISSGRQELALIRQLPENALVAVVSCSTIILQQAEAVIKALRGEEIYVRPILLAQESPLEIERVLKRAQAAFADCVSLPKLQALSRKPIQTIPVISPPELEKLQAFRANGDGQ
jgi:GntR family transcriptional regulator